MHKINVTKFRNHLSTYLQQVNEGEEICINSRGRIIARLLPPIDKRTMALEHLKLLRTRCKIGDVISSVEINWEVES